jgi:hypothetical protein
MAIGDQDGGRVAVAVPGMLAGGILQPLSLCGIESKYLDINREGGGTILIPPGLFPSPTILIAPGVSPHSLPQPAKNYSGMVQKSGPSFVKSPQAGECQFDSPQDGLDD